MTLRNRNDSSASCDLRSPEPEAHYLSALSGAMAAELIEKKMVGVSGLGVFSVRHYPAERRSEKEGDVYHPPANRIMFEQRPVSPDEFADMLSRRMHLDASEARRLSEDFPALFARSMQENEECRFPGFGRVYARHNALAFEADQSLAGILNSEYGSLDSIALSAAELEIVSSRPMKAVLLPVIGLILVALAYLFLFYPGVRHPKAGTSEQAPVISRSLQPDPELRHEDSTAGVPLRGQVLLEEGEYSVVLGTYRKKETAEREVRSVSLSETVFFVWPVIGKGKQYYRLAAGRFTSFGAAKAWMDSTGLGRSGKAYVQQAKRRVVLHGEEGL
ncbi:SPOR domain-containing protein [Chlorobium limicola]